MLLGQRAAEDDGVRCLQQPTIANVNDVDTLLRERQRYRRERFSSRRSFGGFTGPTDAGIGPRISRGEFQVFGRQVWVVLSNRGQFLAARDGVTDPPDGQTAATEHRLPCENRRIRNDPSVAPPIEAPRANSVHWPILCDVASAVIYAFASIKGGQRRPDIGKMITCFTFAGSLPVSAIFLFVAVSGDHEALAHLAGEPDFRAYAGIAAVVVLYHGLEHLHDAIRSAWVKEVMAVPGEAPTAAGDRGDEGGRAA